MVTCEISRTIDGGMEVRFATAVKTHDPTSNDTEGLPRGVRVAVATHGCKLNQAESQAMGRRLAELGCSLVDPEGDAEIYVLNTCTVTRVADGKARQWLRAAHRRNPGASVIATGCYASRDPGAVSGVEGVSLVMSNRDKGRLPEVVRRLALAEKHGHTPSSNGRESGPEGRQPTRTRAFLKVQEGCNQFCAFCIVPYTRGREANVPIPEVVEQVRARVREGCKEVVITGPQIGSYGLYPPSPESRRDPENYEGRLHGLIEAILRETDVARLRVSSIQPQDLTPRLLSAWKDPRLCRHVHMALQSGCDPVLERMGRRYSTYGYRRAVEKLRGAVPDIAITTDVMAGFQGETEKEFEEGYRFCEIIGFAGIHVFPYSPRPGTRAYAMPGRVPGDVKKERADRLLALARESALRFRRSFLGRRLEVLWEEKQRIEGRTLWSGLTDNYLRVYTRDPGVEANQIALTTLQSEIKSGLVGCARAGDSSHVALESQ